MRLIIEYQCPLLLPPCSALPCPANVCVAAAGIALGRLKEERKQWRKDPPYGFYARPEPKASGGSNLMKWCVAVRECAVVTSG